ncbi:MAG: Tm-1-like ATP-binding domain-containing protein [Oscillospiraceae bacterium]|nr:Tm-1-like ATP-binding domain-containing protein [Oscillospiraceae bacterium]
MAKKAVVCLVGTLDTKGEEYAFVKERLIDAGVDVLMIDTGVLAEPHFAPDIGAAAVAKEAGVTLADFRQNVEGSTRVNANKAMGSGVTVILKKLIAEGKIDAVLGMGGTGGTDLISGAYRQLPLGFPKVLVSTMASNNTKPYVGCSDMAMFNAVTDIAGLNSVSRVILSNAAHAAAGMAKDYETTKKYLASANPLIAITMFGVTTPGVMAARAILESSGYDVVIFHAVGQGAAMEELIDAGVINGLIDMTLPELLNCKNGGIFSAGTDRMNAAIRAKVPQVISLGAIECFNFGAPPTIPAEYNTPERKVILHNPNITSLLATPDELVWLGEYVADKANQAVKNTPVAVMIPLKGLDKYMAEGGPWHGAEYLEPLFQTLRGKLDSAVERIEMNNFINDEEFGQAVANKFIQVWKASGK